MAHKYVILWHGTSRSRADSIAKTGFYRNSYFAKLVGISWAYAAGKKRPDDPGVLVLCAIDLSLYAKHDYEIRKNRVYSFKPPVPKEAVVGIFRIDRFNRTELNNKANLFKSRIKKLKIGPRPPEIVIARNCGAEAIAYWMNMYLSSRTDRRVEITHPGVRRISAWVGKNYDSGRISPISEKEMLMQARRYVPEFFKDVRIASPGA